MRWTVRWPGGFVLPNGTAARLASFSISDPENALSLRQQAIEKALKAHVQVTTDDVPPKIHSLMKLAQLAKLWEALGQNHQEVLLTIDPHVVAGRYGPPNSENDRTASQADAAGLIERVEETAESLLTRLT